ncbi:MAG: hypothetical protein ACRD2X_26790 [Vicinamibacteraceae bacterium]
MHAKPAHDGPDDRQIFLILRGQVRAMHVAATGGTRDGQRRLVGFIDPPRHGPVVVAPVGCARAPARRATAALPVSFRKRRGFPEACPARRIELILEPLVTSLQPITFALGARQRLAQLRNLVLLSFDQRVAIIRRWGALNGHAFVMPELPSSYKYKTLDRCRSCVDTR